MRQIILIVFSVLGICSSFILRFFFGIDLALVAIFVTISIGLPALVIKTDFFSSKQRMENTNFEPRVTTLSSSKTKKITDIGISNKLLNEMHSKILNIVHEEFLDAKLSDFSISVYPFREIPTKFVLFYFFSKISNKKITYRFNVSDLNVTEVGKPKFVRTNYDKCVFSSLPWIESPNWTEFLKIAYSMVPQLSSHPSSQYQIIDFISIHGSPKWTIKFEDGATGDDHCVTWNGKNLDSESIVKDY